MAVKKAAAKKVAAKPSSMGAFREKLTKRYGTAVMRKDMIKPYEVIPTGSISLDIAHRTGGWVEGRIHEIVGPEGVGKTTLAIKTLVEAQKKYPNKAVQYIDMEQTFDYDWAEANGLDTSDDRWLHIYPDDSEDVSDLLKEAIRTDLFSVVVVDSIGGMESKAAFEKDADESAMGKGSQVITRMVKFCAVLANKHQVTVLLINQLRADIGNPRGGEKSAGPNAMKYSTTTKVRMSRGAGERILFTLPGDTAPVEIGRQVRARVERSKVAIQGKVAEFYLINADTPDYGPVGIDQADEIVNIGNAPGYDLFRRRGSWYDYDDRSGTEIKINGAPALKEHLRSCPDDLAWLKERAVEAKYAEVTEEREIIFEHAGEEA